jgi:hypothetical protein
LSVYEVEAKQRTGGPQGEPFAMVKMRSRSLLVVVRVALAVLMIFGAASRKAPGQAPPGVRLPADMNNGVVFYESFGDNRPTNTTNPGVGENPLEFGGIFELHNGSVINTGPLFMSEVGFYPYVQLDQQRNLLLLHPGTFSTASLGACVSVLAPKDGTYNVSGAFARANSFQLAGDGVDVAVFRNLNTAVPLYGATISANHLVNAEDPFSGTGVAEFSFQVSLVQGDVLRSWSSAGRRDRTGRLTSRPCNSTSRD